MTVHHTARGALGLAALGLAVATACSSREDGSGAGAARTASEDAFVAPSAPRDAAPAAPPVGSLAGKLPRAPRAFTITPGQPPPAVLRLDRDGYRLHRAPATWSELATLDLAAGTVFKRHDRARDGALELLASGGGPAADQARAFRDALEVAAANTGVAEVAGEVPALPGDDDEAEVSLTYLIATDAALPATTPLLVVAPDLNVEHLLGALDVLGGVIAVEADGALAAMALAAPWAEAGWGGAPAPDDAPTYDAWIVRGGLVIDAHAGAEMRRLAIVDGGVDVARVEASLARFRARLPAGAEPVVDVLVADHATVQDLVDGLAALHAAGARRVGVGVAPWRTPAFGPDGAPVVAARAAATVEVDEVRVDGALDEAVVGRYLRRVRTNLVACYLTRFPVPPASGADVRLELTIDSQGRISTARVTGPDPEVDACVTGVVEALELPKPKQGRDVRATTTLRFRPAEP